jgi:hypothetical protein
VLAALAAAPVVAAQHTAPGATIAGQLVPALTGVDPIPGGDALAELRVVQPVLQLRAAWGPGRLQATLDGEGWSMPGGELAPGVWGEGFVDRRHPHTYVHEVMFTGADLLGGRDGAAHVSLSAGKGFAPFGTDDPMSRPPLRYPVNHHLAQILERAVAIAGVGTGPVLLEGAVFNGDEPEHPSQWPSWDRFGDSWSARLTVAPLRHLELQASVARVHSPEHRPGAGPDQDKSSASARWDRPGPDGRTYLLLEWAHTVEAEGFFDFTSVLAEAEVRRGPHRAYARLERTERPEEERLADPFRSLRPHLDDAIVGITRWTVATAGYGLRLPLRALDLVAEPLGEVSTGTVVETTGSIFDPVSFYGRDTFWVLTIAVRLSRGLDGHRMGRYGVFPRTGPADAGHGP